MVAIGVGRIKWLNYVYVWKIQLSEISNRLHGRYDNKTDQKRF